MISQHDSFYTDPFIRQFIHNLKVNKINAVVKYFNEIDKRYVNFRLESNCYHIIKDHLTTLKNITKQFQQWHHQRNQRQNNQRQHHTQRRNGPTSRANGSGDPDPDPDRPLSFGLNIHTTPAAPPPLAI